VPERGDRRVQVFISYARDDDRKPPPGSPGREGFVTYLHGQLEFAFRDLGPDRPKFWRDVRRDGVRDDDLFEPVIADALSRSDFLLVVLSPNWLSRPFCRKELDLFAERWKREGIERVKRRIFLVNKGPVAPDDRPSLLQGRVGHSFHSRDPDEPEYAFFVLGRVADDRYYECLDKLVGDLRDRMDRPKQGLEGGATEDPSTRPDRRIFVAKPAADMRSAYDRVVNELTERGYAVVPDPKRDIPFDSSACNFINEAVKSARASVHLLGEKRGGSPDEGLPPIVALQLQSAAAADPGFLRLIWAPKVMEYGGGTPQAGEREPVEVLKRFDRQLASDQVIGDNLSEFVAFLGPAIEKLFPRAPDPDGSSSVYVLHDAEDRSYALNIAKALKLREIEPVLSAIQGSESGLRELHRKRLLDCDTVVLCWATASEVWAMASAMELKNWRALGRTRQFTRRALAVGPPPRDVKLHLIELPPRSEIDLVLDLTSAEPSFESVAPLFEQ
jgi:hypothetical protein